MSAPLTAGGAVLSFADSGEAAPLAAMSGAGASQAATSSRLVLEQDCFVEALVLSEQRLVFLEDGVVFRKKRLRFGQTGLFEFHELLAEARAQNLDTR